MSLSRAVAQGRTGGGPRLVDRDPACTQGLDQASDGALMDVERRRQLGAGLGLATDQGHEADGEGHTVVAIGRGSAHHHDGTLCDSTRTTRTA